MLFAHFDGIPHHPEELQLACSLAGVAALGVRLFISRLKHSTQKTPMPCDTIQTMKVDIGKLDPQLAAAAIQNLGLSGSVQYVNGKLEIYGPANRDTITEQVRQAYSAEVVKSQARKYGWAIKETGNGKFKVIRK